MKREKAVYIREEYIEDLAVKIKEAEGRATARTITPERMIKAVQNIESYILSFSTKKDAIGTTISVDPNAQTFPKAYKYQPESTQFRAELTAKGWRLSLISRDSTRGLSQAVYIKFTEATKANMAIRLSTMGAWSIL